MNTAIDMVIGVMRLSFFVAVYAWTMILLHYVLFDRLARRRRARWERDKT